MIGKKLDSYVPPLAEIKKAKFILKIIGECEKKGIIISAYGGYGLDGLYGKLTRWHQDGDFFCRPGEEVKASKVLEELGCQWLPFEVNEKWGIVDPDFGKFGVEIHSWKDLPSSLEITEEIFIPKLPNASLFDIPFRAITLEGYKVVTSAVDDICKKNNWHSSTEKLERNRKLFEYLESKYG